MVAVATAAALGGFDFVVARHEQKPATPTAAAPTTVAAFTQASVGQCVTWQQEELTNVTDIAVVDCAKEHRFEIMGRHQLSEADYPAGTNPATDLAVQASFKQGLCQQDVLAALAGKFDFNGKFSVGVLLPNQTDWAAGDRTLLCGVQYPDDAGVPDLFTGQVAGQDQAKVWQPGTCIKLDATKTPHEVPCANKHELEATQVVDLVQQLGETWPDQATQDQKLKVLCQQAAINYLATDGSDEAWYRSTLQPFWTTVAEQNWTAGSRRTTCFLVKANQNGGFATLTGSAKADLLIDGAPPTAVPTRNPKKPGL